MCIVGRLVIGGAQTPSWSRGVIGVGAEGVHREEGIPSTALLPQAHALEVYFGPSDALIVIESDALLPHHDDNCPAPDVARLRAGEENEINCGSCQFSAQVPLPGI